MTSKKPDNNAARELAAVTMKAKTDLAALKPRELAALQKEYELVGGKVSRRVTGATTTAIVTVPFFSLLLASTTTAGAILGGVLFIPLIGALISQISVLEKDSEKYRLLDLNEKLNRLIDDAQRERQKQLLTLADRWLADKGLFGEEEKETLLPYLAAMPPALLEGVSNRLAVTVLQARMMLEHIKNPAEKPKPPTLRVIGTGEENLADLRRLMEATISPYETFRRPPMHLVLPEVKTLQPSEKGAALYMVAWPVLALRDVFKKSKAELDLAKVEMPPLPRVENTYDLLKDFEAANGVLDLPAFTAPPGPRKAISLRPR